jgi:hypothetical protein
MGEGAEDIVELAKAYDIIVRRSSRGCIPSGLHGEAKKAIEKCIWYAMQHAGYKELANWNKGE